MQKRKMLPAAIAASLMSFGTVLPNAYADDEKSMEQQAEYAESGMQDAWLDGKLETALLFNEHLNSFAIDTEVTDGVAYLSGSVESDIDRDLAGEIAKSIDGVRDVENDLAVDKMKASKARDTDDRKDRSGFKQSVLNATLTARVKTQLLVNDNTGGMSIDVDSEDGVVTLSGDVKSEQEKDLAGQIAANTDGAMSVNNRLAIDMDDDDDMDRDDDDDDMDDDGVDDIR